ncbi:MAG TPA: hypothetical protein VGE08_00985 [Steroidobacter sp.]|uniref:hypothetical protein n=1 Tax=Steroidobacter sp. TaxID=1978227 RepID=UPI002ED77CB6
MAHTTHVEHSTGRRKFVDAVSKAIRPRKSPASTTSRAPADDARQEAEFYDAVDRRLMDTFPASDAVARY